MTKTKIIIGDVSTCLAELAKNSVDCVVTSPPYFRLRDYGITGQIGLEPSLQEFVETLTMVFRDVRRVLKPAGTLWLNLGDSYASSYGLPGAVKPNHAGFSAPNRQLGTDRLKNKDLCGVPWRIALALQIDGWYLRNDIIWQKPNANPESVRDRLVRDHEYVFLLTKSPRYFFDIASIRVPSKEPRKASHHPWAHNRTIRREKNGSMEKTAVPMRNRRTVWTITTQAYKGSHFATFPERLVEPCIQAGCPEGGLVLDPFAGSGTTLAVAKRLGRDSIGIELNPDYLPLIESRLAKVDSDQIKTPAAIGRG
jgi:DNA modification methylase